MMETVHSFLNWLHLAYSNNSGVFGFVAFAATIIPVLIGMITALRIRQQQKKMAQPVNLVLVNAARRLVLPYAVLRSQLSRAELMGILSNYCGPERFHPAQFLDAIESQQFRDAMVGKIDRLDIACLPEFYQAAEQLIASRKKS